MSFGNCEIVIIQNDLHKVFKQSLSKEHQPTVIRLSMIFLWVVNSNVKIKRNNHAVADASVY